MSRPPSLLLWALALAGCSATLVGDGVETAEERQVGYYDSVHAQGFVRLVLEDGPPSVTVICDENLLPYIETEAVANDLRVSLDPSAGPVRTDLDCRAEISAPRFAQIVASDAGGITSADPLPGNRSIATSGAADIDLAEVTSEEVIRVTSTGPGSISVDLLEGARVLAQATGAGDVRLGAVAVEVAEARASGAGDVHLEGITEDLTILFSGSGEVDTAGLLAEAASVTCTGTGRVAVYASVAIEIQQAGACQVEVWGDPPERDIDSEEPGAVTFR